MDYRIERVIVKDEFKVCPVCGYKDGFHSMLKRKQERFVWLFICPSCHAVFDVGYTADLQGGDGTSDLSLPANGL